MRIEIQLDEERARKLALIQEKTQQAFVELVNQAIDVQYQQLDERKKTPFEAFQEAGLIGCINAEPDLSVNYKEKVYEYLREKYRQGRL